MVQRGKREENKGVLLRPIKNVHGESKESKRKVGIAKRKCFKQIEGQSRDKDVHKELVMLEVNEELKGRDN